jgi:hypothetical protein
VIYQLAVSAALIVAILLAFSWLEWARTRPARADGPHRLSARLLGANDDRGTAHHREGAERPLCE